LKPVRVGVIGVGHLGKEHARVYSELAEAELVGIMDADPDRAAEVAARCHTDVAGSLEGLLAKGVKAMSIAVPTSLHHRIAFQALKHGVHVLIEKPISRTLREADSLISLARRSGLVLQVGHIERFNGAVRALQGVIGRPLFIESHRLSPFAPRGTDVAVVLELMIHDIDIILSLVQSSVKRIAAVGAPVLSHREDIANARIEFADGCVANVTASRVSREKVRKIRIFEQDAYISLDYLNQRVDVYRKRIPTPTPALSQAAESPPEPCSQPADPASFIHHEVLPVDHEESLVAELRSFVQCIQERTAPLVGGREGREALAVALRIVRAIKRRRI
jgi:predicted dehydrogenase